MAKVGFDNQQYLQMQSQHIRDRISKFGGKLYLEFGGKLFDDYHASRVLPGFEPDSKIRMLEQLKDKAEIIIAINAGDIEKNKVRGDLGITYDSDVLRLIDIFRGRGLPVGGVVVTAPGPGSGKMATCLSQLYHDHKRGVVAGYAKFETFPIWNLPLKHPVNLAYEAATADLDDVNMIDPFHLQAYGQTTVNYNRDVEVFPVLSAMFEKIIGSCPYQSPTDMGVNMAGNCIVDDEVCRQAAGQEIIRRYYDALCERRQGKGSEGAVYKLELLMKQAGVSPDQRPGVAEAARLENETGEPVMAIQLADGRIVTGKTSELMGCSAAALLNALKALSGVGGHGVHLIAQSAIEPIQTVKVKYLGSNNPRLHSDEVLTALAASANQDAKAVLALKALAELHGCQAHCSVILSPADAVTYRKLGIQLTCEPKYQTNQLYHR